MSLLSWIVCVVFVILVIDSILRRMRLNAYVKDLPQISSLVLLPNLWQTKTSTELFQIFEKVVNSCDGLFSIWVGTKLVIHCDDPVNMKTILMSKNCLDKPYYYRQLSACGDGIFTAQGKFEIDINVPHFRTDNELRKFLNIMGSSRLASRSQKYQRSVHFEHS